MSLTIETAGVGKPVALSHLFLNGVEADYRASALAALTVDEIASSATKIDMVAETVLQVLDDRIGGATVVLINLL